MREGAKKRRSAFFLSPLPPSFSRLPSCFRKHERKTHQKNLLLRLVEASSLTLHDTSDMLMLSQSHSVKSTVNLIFVCPQSLVNKLSEVWPRDFCVVHVLGHVKLMYCAVFFVDEWSKSNVRPKATRDSLGPNKRDLTIFWLHPCQWRTCIYPSTLREAFWKGQCFSQDSFDLKWPRNQPRTGTFCFQVCTLRKVFRTALRNYSTMNAVFQGDYACIERDVTSRYHVSKMIGS